MTRSERSYPPHAKCPSASSGGYRPGGPVGRMHEDLNRCLGQGLADRLSLTVEDHSAGERAVRAVSIASGPAALLAAYAGVLLLVWR